MSLSINTNIASMQAQNSLSSVNKTLQQNQERLSTGLRINSAKDDAAGLAISDRMNAQITGMNQAARNANDGISMMQTAEGGMQEITNILQRMRELGVQSANESNTQSDRESLNQEFQDLSSELNRIAESTTFNGKNILDGSLGTADFQVGADTTLDNRIEVDMSTSMEANAIGSHAEGGLEFAEVTATTFANMTGADQLTNGQLEINGVSIDNLSDFGSDLTSTQDQKGEDMTSAYALAKAINAKAAEGLLEVSAEAEGVQQKMDNAKVTGTGSYTLSINGENIVSGYDLDANGDLETDDLVQRINDASGETGVTAKNDSGNLVLESEGGRNINVDEVSTQDDGGLTGTLTGGTNSIASYRGEVTLQADSGIRVSSTTDVSGVFDGDGGDLDTTDAEIQFNTSNLDTTNILDESSARSAVRHIDSAINDVDSFRATMGASQNRLESTIANLENASQNLNEARSRIQDADIAKEAAEMTQNNVRRQASSAVLAQANQNPQLALQLLGQ